MVPRRPQARLEAHIEAGGVDEDVLLVETDDLNDEIDAAYREKYRRYAENIVGSIVSPQARAATLKLVPRWTGPTSPRTSTPRALKRA